MIALIGAILALCLGPLLYRVARPYPGSLALLDGFTFVGITGLVLFEIFPQSVEAAGVGALAVALIGFLAPALTESHWHRLARPAHTAALVLAVLGILAHTVVDGLALVDTELTLAVILHRLPVGLTLWWLLRPAYGAGVAIGTIVVLSLTTAAGYFSGTAILSQFSPVTLGLFQALVGGSLLHVVVHITTPMLAEARSKKWQAGMGALAGIIFLVVFLSAEHGGAPAHDHGGAHHHHDHEAFFDFFYELAVTSAPALLLGYIAAGLVHGFLPQASLRWLTRGSATRQSLKGLLFGLPLPVCSCGVVPLYRSLTLRGVPPAAGLTFLVATPELGVDAVLLSIPLLGTELTLIRVTGATLAAIIVGVVVSRLVKAPVETASAPETETDTDTRSFSERCRATVHSGLGELVDFTGPWILLGLAVAAFAQPLLEGDWRPEASPVLEVIVFALLGLPTYVCATGATPLVAVLVAGGVSPGAGLAFLLTGPATNVTTFGVLSSLHGKTVALAFAGCMVSLAVVLGISVDAVFPSLTTLPAGSHEHPAPWQVACLGVLAILFVLSLLRQGPRGFVGQIVSPGGRHHDHDHSHGDDADPACCETG